MLRRIGYSARAGRPGVGDLTCKDTATVPFIPDLRSIAVAG
jgi:hypothetical protein